MGRITNKLVNLRTGVSDWPVQLHWNKCQSFKMDEKLPEDLWQMQVFCEILCGPFPHFWCPCQSGLISPKNHFK